MKEKLTARLFNYFIKSPKTKYFWVKQTARAAALCMGLSALFLFMYDLQLIENYKSSGKETILDPNGQRAATQPTHYYGIDISHYQGNLLKEIDANDHLSFIIIKATQGAHYVDPDFYSNWQGIKDKGLIRGAYHFYVTKDDPVGQAEHFYKVVGRIGSDDIAPIVDVERSSLSSAASVEELQRDLKIFLKTAEAKFARKPMIYTNYAFAEQYLKNPEFATYELWLAEYSDRQKPLIPEIWKKIGYKIWQKSESYTIESVKTDFDSYFGYKVDLVNQGTPIK